MSSELAGGEGHAFSARGDTARLLPKGAPLWSSSQLPASQVVDTWIPAQVGRRQAQQRAGWTGHQSGRERPCPLEGLPELQA